MQNQTTPTRSLGLWSIVLFGLAYMTPMIVLATFGPLAAASQGTTAMAYLLAAGAIFLTAVSYSVMAGAFPVAGSAYSYVRKALGGYAGFITGWSVLLDYLFLPMVIWLIGASYLTTAYPGVPAWGWLLGFIGLTTTINFAGLAFASRVNAVLMLAQFVVLGAFLFLAARYIVAAQGLGGLASVEPFFKHDVPLGAAIAGAGIAAYSFLGFDAVSTLTEDTRDPTRTMPRAILIIALVGGVLFIGSSYVVQLAHPGFQFESVDAAAFEIAKRIGSDLFVSVFLITLVLAQFASGLAAQASVGRLLFAMGRDGVIPPSFFGKQLFVWKAPVLNLLLVGLIGFVALALDVTTSTSFINFGAFVAFTAVNLSVIALYLKRVDVVRARGPLVGLIVPALGAACDLALLVNLDAHAMLLGAIWLGLGVIQLAYVTGFFRRQPPQLEFSDT